MKKANIVIPYLQLLVLFLFGSHLSNAQSWDYVNFSDEMGLIINAHIDNNDNVFTSNKKFGNITLSKMNQSGTVEWAKDLTSILYNDNFPTDDFIGGKFGLDGNDTHIFVVGRDNAGILDGAIVQSDYSDSSLPEIIEKIGGTSGTSSIMRDIKVEGDYLYVIGDFGNPTLTPTTNIYFDSSPDNPDKNLYGNFRSGFIAKFSLSTSSLVWAKSINASNSVQPHYLELDNAGNIYVSGEFKGTATFQTPGSGLYSLNSTGTSDNAFLAKFDPLTGDQIDFNPLKRNTGIGSMSAGDIAINELDNIIYWGTNDITAHDKNTGEALSPWTSTFPASANAKVFSLIVNDCGDLYVTGTVDDSFFSLLSNQNRNSGFCDSRFFATSLNAQDGSTVWITHATDGCESLGSEVLINSLNEELILGAYDSQFGSNYFEIDNDPALSANLDASGFIGKYNDSDVDQCCMESVSLGGPISICQNEAFPTLNIIGQVTASINSIQWFHDLSVVANNVQFYTPTAAGNYKVIVNYGDGCITEDEIQLTVKDCYAPCTFKPTINVIPKSHCAYQFTATVPAIFSNGIVGYHWNFGDGSSALGQVVNHAFANPGNYYVILTIYYLDANGNCCTQSERRLMQITRGCGNECNINAKIEMEYIANDVYFFNALSATINTGVITIIGYEWTVNNIVVSTDPSFAMEITGNPDICLTVYGFDDRYGCCQDRTCQRIARSRGAEENPSNNKFGFKAFPNPVNDVLNLEFEILNSANQSVNIQIYDALGKALYKTQVDDTQHQINISNWNAGIYFCTAEVNGKVMVKKIIKGKAGTY